MVDLGGRKAGQVRDFVNRYGSVFREVIWTIYKGECLEKVGD